MPDLPPWTARPLAAVLAPLLLPQGRHVRRSTPMLPEAAGLRSGVAGEGREVPLRLLVLGESTAAGVGVPHQRDGLAAHLATALVAVGTPRVAWRVVARAGMTARRAHRELVPRATAVPFDLAVLVLGVNDTLRLRRPDRWRSDVGALVDALHVAARPGARIVLAGTPDLAAFPALPAPLRPIMGAHSRALDGELARLARPRPEVRHAPVPAAGVDAFAADGFHPGEGGYRRWAATLAAAAPGGPPS